MSIKGFFGSLANLGKILEEASDPESQVREDKRESKPKTLQNNYSTGHKKKAIDPKRKAWHDRRLREQTGTPQVAPPPPANVPMPSHSVTRSTAASVSTGLLDVLANAKDAKPKDGSKKPEAWRRKPGDPIF